MKACKVDTLSELDCTTKFIQQIGGLCQNTDYSDVSLIVERTALPAHKCILAARSAYFRALLYPLLGEESTPTEIDIDVRMTLDSNNIELKVPLEAFKHVLKFIYTGRVHLSKMENSIIVDLLRLAHDFGIDEIESSVSTSLLKDITLENCCAVLNAACSYNLTPIKDAALLFMDDNATEVVKSSNFKTLSQKALTSLLERDSFCAPEIDIFRGVLDWRKHDHSETEFQVMLYGLRESFVVNAAMADIRFKLMDLGELLGTVKEASIFDSEQLLDIVREKVAIENINYRYILKPNKNVASMKNFNAKTVSGTHPLEVIDGNVTIYDGTSGYTSHPINTSQQNCIIIELKAIFLINHIKVLLWDVDDRSYSYFVEVSIDQTKWERISDHSEFFCRSWQNLHFKACPVRYIKLVGTHNTANSDFHVVEVEAFHSATPPKVVNELISPTVNVATKEKGAKVIQGICHPSDTLDVLLNGNVSNHTGSSGYVYHNIGDGSIVIQLAQPHHIGSMRILLWDQDERTYSFYVETSVNKKDWTIAVDKRNELLKSWQELNFEPRPVAFIKIIGTHNSANNGFHIVHFETPSIARG